MFQFGLTHKEVRGRRLPQEPRNRDLGIIRPPERAFPIIETHLSPYLSSARHFRTLHAGAGGARNLAISPRISTNNFLGTATSAIWKVT